MFRHLSLCWTILLVSAVCPVSVAATRDDPELKLETPRRLGPFRVQPYFQIKQAGYDDNIFLEPDRKEGDFTSTLVGGAKAVTLFGHRAALLLSDELGYVAFINHSELNHLNNSVRAKLDLFLGPLLIYTEARRADLRERPSTEVDIRARQSQRAYALGFEGALSAKTAAEVRFTSQKIRFGSGADAGELAASGVNRQAQLLALQELNRTESGAAITLKYNIRPKTTLGLEWGIERADFDQPSSTRNTRGRRLSLRVWMDPSSSLSVNLSLGQLRLEALDREEQDFSGLVGEVNLGYRIFSRGRAKASFNRDAVFSIQGDNLFYVTTGWGVAYMHQFTQRWGVELEHSREKLDYPLPFQGFSQGTESGLRQDDLRINSLAGFVRFREGDRIGLRISRWERDSTFEPAETERFVVSSFVEYSF